jgi:hypothetical protein
MIAVVLLVEVLPERRRQKAGLMVIGPEICVGMIKKIDYRKRLAPPL